jgi:hypothetical protein
MRRPSDESDITVISRWKLIETDALQPERICRKRIASSVKTVTTPERDHREGENHDCVILFG